MRKATNLASQDAVASRFSGHHTAAQAGKWLSLAGRLLLVIHVNHRGALGETQQPTAFTQSNQLYNEAFSVSRV